MTTSPLRERLWSSITSGAARNVSSTTCRAGSDGPGCPNPSWQRTTCVYGAVSKEAAETELDNLEAKWGEQYPIVIKSWRDNWERLTEFFQYTKEILRLIYTTNTVEGYHRQIRKVTKNKGVFPSDSALEKLVYLAYRNISEKWTMPLANWALISQQLAIKIGDRFEIM